MGPQIGNNKKGAKGESEKKTDNGRGGKEKRNKKGEKLEKNAEPNRRRNPRNQGSANATPRRGGAEESSRRQKKVGEYDSSSEHCYTETDMRDKGGGCDPSITDRGETLLKRKIQGKRRGKIKICRGAWESRKHGDLRN